MKDKVTRKVEKVHDNGSKQIVEVTSWLHETSKDEGEYVKFYINAADVFSKMPPSCAKVIIEITRYMTYANASEADGGQIISITPNIKAKILKNLGITKSTFHSHLKELLGYDVIKKIGYATYQVNPHIIGRGFYFFKKNHGGIKDLRLTYKQSCKQAVNI